MIAKTDIDRGTKVHYKPAHYAAHEWENGIVKEIPKNGEHCFVVYHCGHNWDNYQDYTAAFTPLKDLYLGWPHE